MPVQSSADEHCPGNLCRQQPGQHALHVWADYTYSTDPATNTDILWHGYWIGVLSDTGMPTSTLMCPEANDLPNKGGMGLAHVGWSGKGQSVVTPVNYSAQTTIVDSGKKIPDAGTYRVGTYGMNVNACRQDSLGYVSDDIPQAHFFGNHLSALRDYSDIPVFFDSTWVDVFLNEATPLTPPSDLTGAQAQTTLADHDAYRTLITRHGYAINMAFADGHATTIPLTTVYNHLWYSNFPKQIFLKGGPGGIPSK